jgi:hypothetical protein
VLAGDGTGAARGLDGAGQGEVYYATLMRFAGCAATSHEIAAAFGGDDIVVRARGDLIDPAEPAEALQFLASLGVDAGRLQVLGGPAGVAGLKAEGARADCEVGAGLTARLRLPDAVRRAVLDSFERFDGRGVPAGRAGAEVAEASRFAAVGYAAVMFDAVGGGDVAAQTVARWSGRALDPAIAVIFQDAPGESRRFDFGLRVCRAWGSTVLITRSGATFRAMRHRPLVPSLPSAGSTSCPATSASRPSASACTASRGSRCQVKPRGTSSRETLTVK